MRENDGYVSNCYRTSDANGVDFVGGLMGDNVVVVAQSSTLIGTSESAMNPKCVENPALFFAL